MIVSETKISDREKPHSASLPVLKHILTEIWFMSWVHDTKTHRLLWPAVCITTESHPSKLNVSNNSTSTQRFKTNPIRHILWQLLSLGSAVILSTAQLRKTVVSTVDSVFFLKAISHYQLSAVNYSFHGERLVFALRRINSTRLSIWSYFIGWMQRWSWIPEDVLESSVTQGQMWDAHEYNLKANL